MSPAARFALGCVASPHHLATEAGVAVLRGGGNAMDAAIATNLTLGVVAPYLCGYGGDLFALVWDGDLYAYEGCGRAPADATPDEIRARARTDRMPFFGPLSITVPGAVEAWFTLIERFGTRSFEELSRAALAYARDGYVVSERGAQAFVASRARYGDEEEWGRVYGAVVARSRLAQPELARTIETLAARGHGPYYRGEIAEAIAAHVRARGGLLSADDLAAHEGRWVEPLRASYRDVTVVEMPPPTQGVAALEAMRIAAGLDAEPGEARDHVLIEATKQALADRDAYVSDPDAMTLPADRLLADDWVASRRARIDPARAAEPPPGRPARGGTAYLCAADADGMLVSLIQSNYAGFGSGVTVPGWGINLQNRGGYFSLDPGHVNVIAPRKRTMHTLIPAMAFRGGEPWLVFGTMGGDGQAQTHLQLVARIVDAAADPQDAIDGPRWIVSPDDWTVTAEARFGAAWFEAQRARGHRLVEAPAFDALMGHAHAIALSPEGYLGATDPRAEGAVLGV